MNYEQRIRALTLEIADAGNQNPAHRMKPGLRASAAKEIADIYTFPEDGGPATGFGGETISQWLERRRGLRPDDFESGAAPVSGGPSPTRNGGSDAELIARAKQQGGYTNDQWEKLSYGKRAEIVDRLRDRSPIAGHESWRKGAPKASLPAGMSPEQFAALPVEERLRHANEASRPEGYPR
jgi:hypothetical protein